jgi:glutamine amidotransferase PdxT
MERQVDFKEYFVTCLVNNCENKEVKIQVKATAIDPLVICGPCSTPITKIVPVTA